MIQPILIGIALLISTLGFFRVPQPLIWDKPSNILGAVSFPSSLDALTNPAATDSVATVSHSSQHSNANDAIEALEAKLGTGASTPITDTIFVGDGTGTSRFSTFATTTSLRSTNITATGSSTLQNFTFVNATGTNATTTNFYATTASTTNLRAANFSGAALTTCTGTNFLQYSSGEFLCTTVSTAGTSVVSTTTVNNMSTSTIDIPTADNIVVRISIPNIVGGGATTTATLFATFDSDTAANYSYTNILDNGAVSVQQDKTAFQVSYDASGNFRPGWTGEIHFWNSPNLSKTGQSISSFYATTTNNGFNNTAMTTSRRSEQDFVWNKVTGRATTMKIGWNVPNVYMGTSTIISILAY